MLIRGSEMLMQEQRITDINIYIRSNLQFSRILIRPMVFSRLRKYRDFVFQNLSRN